MRLVPASALPRFGSDEPKVSEATLYRRNPKHSVTNNDVTLNLARINGIAEKQQGERPFKAGEMARDKRIDSGGGVVPIDQLSLYVDVHGALTLTRALIIGVTVKNFIVRLRATCSECKQSQRCADAELCQ